MWDFSSNFLVEKNLLNELGMKLKNLWLILLKNPNILRPDGRKMQKKFTFKSFLHTFKETLRVEIFEKHGRGKHFFIFSKLVFPNI